MAFVHCNSEECTKSELDLFQIAPTQTSLEKSLYIEVPPLSALSDLAPLEFFIPGNGEDYLDLNDTLLHITCKIVRADGTAIPNDTRVTLANYPIATMFSQLDVTLGDTLVSQSNNCYPYRALIELLLNYSGETLATRFSTGAFFKDTARHHESTVLDGPNQGFAKRAALTNGSRKVELLGHLHTDLFFQPRLMINGVDLKIKLTRAKDAFCLLTNDAAAGFKVQILTASLFVKRVKVAPGIRLAHAEAMRTTTAKYPVDRVSMKVFSIAAGTRVSNVDNLFLGQLPKQLVLALVDNDSFSGEYTKNPFNFKHYNVNFVALYVDGEQTPLKPLQPDYEVGTHAREYMSLLQSAGKHLEDRPFLTNCEEFGRGYALYGFNLTPDQECGDHYSLIKTGNLRAEIRFAFPLPDTVNLVVYAAFDSVIEINQNRNVLFDHA
ncbi:uncharacterized protein F54H12.2-like [Sphaerodactylus townsendi]|uniref:uncharacterized protein F54H12.2-like n=1 Tax=Sphaerodactylus townsendi TaxID=933632 RepID=UPI002026356B|nr:uncharacterized protein F54H12.2-like [Sphaerodactylus townsendi]